MALDVGFVENLGSVARTANVDILTVTAAEHFRLPSSTSSAEKPVWGLAAAAVVGASFCFFYWIET